jgi:hypothetical protein
MLNLAIQHNIHLTREQRYMLHDGQTIDTIGVSVPVWFMQKKTSEPAKEVFCQYKLSNPKKDMPIQILEDGYEITLPYREGTELTISDEEWRYLFFNNQSRLDALYKNIIPEISSKHLLDVKDGGCGCLNYREHNKAKHGDRMMTIMHYICIESIEVLLENITFSSLIVSSSD